MKMLQKEINQKKKTIATYEILLANSNSNEAANSGVVQCNLCFKSFASKEFMLLHRTRKHSISDREPGQNEDQQTLQDAQDKNKDQKLRSKRNSMDKRNKGDDDDVLNIWNIYVVDATGKTITLDANAAAPTDFIFQSIEQLENIKRNRIRLIHNGKPLLDGTLTLKQTGLRNGGTLYLVELPEEEKSMTTEPNPNEEVARVLEQAKLVVKETMDLRLQQERNLREELEGLRQEHRQERAAFTEAIQKQFASLQTSLLEDLLKQTSTAISRPEAEKKPSSSNAGMLESDDDGARKAKGRSTKEKRSDKKLTQEVISSLEEKYNAQREREKELHEREREDWKKMHDKLLKKLAKAEAKIKEKFHERESEEALKPALLDLVNAGIEALDGVDMLPPDAPCTIAQVPTPTVAPKDTEDSITCPPQACTEDFNVQPSVSPVKEESAPSVLPPNRGHPQPAPVMAESKPADEPKVPPSTMQEASDKKASAAATKIAAIFRVYALRKRFAQSRFWSLHIKGLMGTSSDVSIQVTDNMTVAELRLALSSKLDLIDINRIVISNKKTGRELIGRDLVFERKGMLEIEILPEHNMVEEKLDSLVMTHRKHLDHEKDIKVKATTIEDWQEPSLNTTDAIVQIQAHVRGWRTRRKLVELKVEKLISAKIAEVDYLASTGKLTHGARSLSDSAAIERYVHPVKGKEYIKAHYEHHEARVNRQCSDIALGVRKTLKEHNIHGDMLSSEEFQLRMEEIGKARLTLPKETIEKMKSVEKHIDNILKANFDRIKAAHDQDDSAAITIQKVAKGFQVRKSSPRKPRPSLKLAAMDDHKNDGKDHSELEQKRERSNEAHDEEMKVDRIPSTNAMLKIEKNDTNAGASSEIEQSSNGNSDSDHISTDEGSSKGGDQANLKKKKSKGSFLKRLFSSKKKDKIIKNASKDEDEAKRVREPESIKSGDNPKETKERRNDEKEAKEKGTADTNLKIKKDLSLKKESNEDQSLDKRNLNDDMLQEESNGVQVESLEHTQIQKKVRKMSKQNKFESAPVRSINETLPHTQGMDAEVPINAGARSGDDDDEFLSQETEKKPSKKKKKNKPSKERRNSQEDDEGVEEKIEESKSKSRRNSRRLEEMEQDTAKRRSSRKKKKDSFVINEIESIQQEFTEENVEVLQQNTEVSTNDHAIEEKPHIEPNEDDATVLNDTEGKARGESKTPEASHTIDDRIGSAATMSKSFDVMVSGEASSDIEIEKLADAYEEHSILESQEAKELLRKGKEMLQKEKEKARGKSFSTDELQALGDATGDIVKRNLDDIEALSEELNLNDHVSTFRTATSHRATTGGITQAATATSTSKSLPLRRSLSRAAR